MTAADIHVCSCGKSYPADVDPHEWKPTDAAADKPSATAANPVVPESAVEAHREELARHFNLIDTPVALICECGETFAYQDHEAQAVHRITLALAAAAADLIAANTDDTKADALDGLADTLDAAQNDDRRSISTLVTTMHGVVHDLRVLAAALRTDTTHKDQP